MVQARGSADAGSHRGDGRSSTQGVGGGNAGEVPTRQVSGVGTSSPPRTTTVRLFGSHDFFRLWLAQVVSAMGDWIGFLAIVAIAGRIGGSSPAAAIGVVMIARVLPGFFLAPVAGVLLDRLNRKRVMVGCDVGRGIVLMWLPFISTIPQLVIASLLIEVLTLMWSPAKEAEVPNLVPESHLTTANSLSLVAAYGTFPVAAALFAVLVKVGNAIGEEGSLSFLRLTEESLPVYFDVATFFLSALLISTLRLPGRSRSDSSQPARGIDLSGTLDEFKEGWRFIFVNRRVGAVIVGLGTGLIGGGMLVPLGPLFTEGVLGGGTAGFGLVLFALGTGVAMGVTVVSVIQARLNKPRVFTGSVLAAGVSLLLGASMSTLPPALVLVALLGASAGAAYVLGFTILQESVSDEIRGRTFTALYTVVRLCLILSFAVGPFLSEALGSLSSRLVDGEVSLGDATISVPGVRLTLWLAAIIIVVAGVLAGKVLSQEADGHDGGG